MEYNDWYERYQQYQQNGAQPSGNPQQKPPRKKRERSGVGVPTLVACMLVTALLGGALGGFIGRASGQQVANDPVATQAQTATATPSTADNSTSASDNTANGSASTLLTQSGAASGLTRAQIVEIAAPSVVGIDVEYPSSGYGGGIDYFFGGGNSAGQVQTGSGSGVIVTSDGYIVTCNHVVEDATKITVILNDENTYEATLIGTDARNDLAVIKIDATGLSPATLGDSDMLTVGEDVVAIGNPLGELRGTSTGGMVSALNREVSVEGTTMTLIQHDAAVSPGSSGGGLFNSSGSLIGIVNAKASSDDAEGIGFAIPVNSVKQIISDLIEHGYVKGRAYLGVNTQNVTLMPTGGNGGWGGFFGYSGTSCVLVTNVFSGSAAEAAGIQSGDLILAVDGTEVSSTDDLSSLINAYNAGDQATLTIQRDGEQLELTVTFGEATPDN